MYVKIIGSSSWGIRSKYRLTRSVVVSNFTIPRGFETDGMSLPQWLVVALLMLTGICADYNFMLGVGACLLSLLLCAFTPFVGQSFKAALLHDYLLYSGIVPRNEADKFFFVELRNQGIPLWLSSLYYSLVALNTLIKTLLNNLK